MINLAICIDNNFIMQASTFITSLKITNKSMPIRLFVFSENLSKIAKQQLLIHVEDSNIDIEFITISLEKLPTLPLEGKEHISLATYYRLLIPFLLPLNIEKIIYADCDMIVVDSLADLWNIDIVNTNAATVLDMFDNDKNINTRLLYSKDAGYFNAGLILINLYNWRKNKISEKAIEFIKKNPEKCLAHDQDALNHALNGDYVRLSARYNMQLDFFCDFSSLIVDSKDYIDIEESRRNPCVIHFTGPTKPWLKNCFHPYTKLWDYFQEKTQWRDVQKKYEYKGYKLIKYKIKEFLKKINLYSEKKEFLKESFVQADEILKKLKGNINDKNHSQR